MKEIRARFQQRYNEAEVWSAINPILLKGEIGIESDTGRFKYGDGRTTWNGLLYAFGDGLVNNFYDTVEDLPLAELHPGEIAIVPREYEIKKGTIDEDGNEVDEDYTIILDTPYISLRKNNTYYWTIFSDQKNKPVASSALDYFVLDTSTLG